MTTHVRTKNDSSFRRGNLPSGNRRFSKGTDARMLVIVERYRNVSQWTVRYTLFSSLGLGLVSARGKSGENRCQIVSDRFSQATKLLLA